MPLGRESRYFNILHCSCLRKNNVLVAKPVIFLLSILPSKYQFWFITWLHLGEVGLGDPHSIFGIGGTPKLEFDEILQPWWSVGATTRGFQPTWRVCSHWRGIGVRISMWAYMGNIEGRFPKEIRDFHFYHSSIISEIVS